MPLDAPLLQLSLTVDPDETQVAAIDRVFRERDLILEISGRIEQKGLVENAGHVTVVLRDWGLGKLIDYLVRKAANRLDFAEHFKRLVDTILQQSDAATMTVIEKDLWFEFGHNQPIESYLALPDIDLGKAGGFTGAAYWSREKGRWTEQD